MVEAHRPKSPSAVTWVELTLSTSVPPNWRATTRPPSGDVLESRSPVSTRVGTRGNGVSGGLGGSGTEAAGHRRQYAYSWNGWWIHSLSVNGANAFGSSRFRFATDVAYCALRVPWGAVGSQSCG